MNLRSDCQSAGEAWEKFLEFSPGSREVLAANEILTASGRNPAALLEVRSVGKYRIEWTELSARADAPSRRLAALREWQRAELVRLAFLDFATLPPAGESSARYTALAEFVVGAALVLAGVKIAAAMIMAAAL